MPLSISSSNQRIPHAPYGKLWATALVFTVLFGGFAEIFLRHKGHLKSVTDNSVLWGMEMDKARAQRADVAVIGASRMALGFQVDQFEERTGLVVANVTIDGSSPIPVLEHVAFETGFSGLVLVSVAESHIVSDGNAQKGHRWIQWYQASFQGAEKYNPIFNKKILNFLQSHWVIFSGNCGYRILERIAHPIYIRTVASRSRQAYYREMLTDKDLVRVKSQRLANDIAGIEKLGSESEKLERWRRRLSALKIAVDTIQSRGGRVIFIRFPTTGALGDVFDQTFPKSVYWDSLGALTGAETIHFKDYSELSIFNCPDGSHLNYDDAVKMTDWLADRIGKERR